MNELKGSAYEDKPNIKKIGIISIHYGVNFGSSLQAYALCSYIQKNFDNVYTEVINYIPPRFRLSNRYHIPDEKSVGNLVRFGVRTARSMFNNWKYESYLKQHVDVWNKIYSIEHAQNR